MKEYIGGIELIKRIEEIRKCLENKLFEAALALALTLPDICGQVELPKEKSVINRYTYWIDNHVDKTVFSSQVFDRSFHCLSSTDIYKLRCSFLHSGDDDIDNSQIDEFHLLSPDKTKEEYGYRYGIQREAGGPEKHTAEIDIKYLSEMLCTFAEKYYQTKQPDDFTDHTFTLG